MSIFELVEEIANLKIGWQQLSNMKNRGKNRIKRNKKNSEKCGTLLNAKRILVGEEIQKAMKRKYWRNNGWNLKFDKNVHLYTQESQQLPSKIDAIDLFQNTV